MAVGCQLRLDLVEQRLVGELHRPAESVAQQLAAELPFKRVAAVVEQVAAEAIGAVDRRAVHQLRGGVDRQTGRILRAKPADGIVFFECESKRIDPHVALRAGGVTRMPSDQLPLGEPLGHRLRQQRHVLGRLGQLLAEDHLAEPVAPQDRARPRRPGLRRKRGSQAEDAAAALLPHAIDSPPLRPRHAGNGIVLRQVFVQKRVVGVEQRQDRAVVLEEVGEE